jgi:hypothetical protein
LFTFYYFSSLEVGCVKEAFSHFLTAIECKDTTNLGSFTQRFVNWQGTDRFFAEPICYMVERIANLIDSQEENANLVDVGMSWVLLGYVNIRISSALPTMDPVQSRALKLKYIDLEVCLLIIIWKI